MNLELTYVVLFFALFVVPRWLQRYRVPSAVTALVFGIIAGPGLHLLEHEGTLALLSTLGIVSLFLFAGLDVSLHELATERRPLTEHLLIRALMLAVCTAAVVLLTDLGARASALVSLALLTPSTGFILDSLGGWLTSERDQFWVRSKAIATELLALLVLFFVLQTTSPLRFTLSTAALVAMIAVLPLVFRWFAAVIIPHAPRSEFGFLMMVAVACAAATRYLGVYYLVGAFVVGMSAQQFRTHLPALSSDKMVTAVEAFASLFVPFYFFHAGLALLREDFSLAALGYGVAFAVITIPFRLGAVSAHRAWRLHEPVKQGVRIAMAMLPTTVFTLVLAEILRTQFDAPGSIVGGLVIYAIVTSILPGLVLRLDPPALEDELQRDLL